MSRVVSVPCLVMASPMLDVTIASPMLAVTMVGTDTDTDTDNTKWPVRKMLAPAFYSPALY